MVAPPVIIEHVPRSWWGRRRRPRTVSRDVGMPFTIGFKIFGIALGLLLLMGTTALLSAHMTRTVDRLLVIFDENYFPAYVALSDANIHSSEESAFIRRLLLALDAGDTREKVDELRQRVAATGKASDDELITARRHINRQIEHSLDFADDVALARLDTHLEFLQDERRSYEAVLVRLVSAAESGQRVDEVRLLGELDHWRDDFDRRIATARRGMRQRAAAAVAGTREFQQRVVQIGLALLVMAGLLGITISAAVTMGLVRPVRRLLAGTTAVEQGALDTVVPVTSRDEIGRLTESFNSMVGELRVKAQIRETFGKYVDPRIVAGLLDRPELTDPKGSRRDMTVLFCDMESFTTFSEGMTPAGLVHVLNRYLSLMSEPVRRHNGIIDKYIGDAIMAFWGPPFTGTEEQGRLACYAALDQLAALNVFNAELPDLTGMRRGMPRVNMRVGVATGEVVIGSIGSEHTQSYTLIGDTVNFASRLEGASKAYGTHVLIGEATRKLAAEAIETREIDSVLVVGKTEPECIFELLGRKGDVSAERLQLRDAFAEALAAYRLQAWDEAQQGFEACLALVPDDPPSKTFLDRVVHFRDMPPPAGWNGVWSLHTK